MKITFKDGHYVDRNGNRWNSILFTRKDAIRLSKTMKNCTNCTDCGECVDCHDCSWCYELVGGDRRFLNSYSDGDAKMPAQHLRVRSYAGRSTHPNYQSSARIEGYKSDTFTMSYVMTLCFADGERYRAGSGLQTRRYRLITTEEFDSATRKLPSEDVRQLSRVMPLANRCIHAAVSTYRKLAPDLPKRVYKINAMHFGSHWYSLLWDKLSRARTERLRNRKIANDGKLLLALSAPDWTEAAERLERVAALIRDGLGNADIYTLRKKSSDIDYLTVVGEGISAPALSEDDIREVKREVAQWLRERRNSEQP